MKLKRSLKHALLAIALVGSAPTYADEGFFSNLWDWLVDSSPDGVLDDKVIIR